MEPMCSAAVVQVHRAVTSAQRTPAGVRGGAGAGAAQTAGGEHAGGQAAPWRSHPEAHAEQQQQWLEQRAARRPLRGHQGERGAG